MLLEGKVALVTGASRGIGKAIALLLAENGADVAVNFAGSTAAAEAVAAEIEKMGRKAILVQGDVSQTEVCAEMVDKVVKELGRIDILVNNAGITRDTLLLRMKEEDWDAVLNTNLKGVFNCTKAAVKYMAKQRSGAIVNISSVVALMGNAGIRMSVFPHLYEDGVVIPMEGFDTTSYNDVPLMMLTGSTEFSMFCLGDAYFESEEMQGYTAEEIAAAKAFASKYGSDMYRIFNAQCSAEKMAANYTSNIYLCEVDYGGETSQMKADLGDYGAFHGIFVPMLSTQNNYTATFEGAFEKAGYVAMAKQYNNYLANFLATGDPNGEGLAQWTNWTPESKNSMVFDGTETDAIVELKDVSTTYEQIIAQMEADTSISPELKEKVIKNVMNGRWFSDTLDQHFQSPNLWDVSIQ